MARVGGEIRKLSVYNPQGQWCASIIRRADSVSYWPHHRLPKRLHSWYYRLRATKRLKIPSRHKEGTPDTEELPCGWYIWTMDQQHQEAREWLGRIWCSMSPLKKWRQCQPTRHNRRSPRREIVIQERACVVLQHVPRYYAICFQHLPQWGGTDGRQHSSTWSIWEYPTPSTPRHSQGYWSQGWPWHNYIFGGGQPPHSHCIKYARVSISPKCFWNPRQWRQQWGATVAAAARIKVVATVATSTIPRGRPTQAMTRIGKDWENKIARPSS